MKVVVPINWIVFGSVVILFVGVMAGGYQGNIEIDLNDSEVKLVFQRTKEECKPLQILPPMTSNK